MGENLVSTHPSQNAYAADIVGAPSSDGTAPAPANVDMSDPDTTTSGGFLSSIESMASSAVSGAESAASKVWTGTKAVGSDVLAGVKNTESAVLSPVTGAANSLTMNIVLILAVAGIGIYFIARTGAFKVNAIV